MSYFFFIAEYVYGAHFLHSSVGEHLGWSHVLAILNRAAMNADVDLFFRVCAQE